MRKGIVSSQQSAKRSLTTVSMRQLLSREGTNMIDGRDSCFFLVMVLVRRRKKISCTAEMSPMINNLPSEILTFVFHYLDSVTQHRISRYRVYSRMKLFCQVSYKISYLVCGVVTREKQWRNNICVAPSELSVSVVLSRLWQVWMACLKVKSLHLLIQSFSFDYLRNVTLRPRPRLL